jgi:hypothetical protein
VSRHNGSGAAEYGKPIHGLHLVISGWVQAADKNHAMAFQRAPYFHFSIAKEAS